MASSEFIYMLPPKQHDQIISGPALASLNGAMLNFQDPPDQSRIAQVITPIYVAVIAVLVLLRFYSKALVQRSVHIGNGKNRPHKPNLEWEDSFR